MFGAEKIEPGDYDFTALDRIMPHPVYAAQSFICVLNPSDATADKVKNLLAEAYDIASQRQARRDEGRLVHHSARLCTRCTIATAAISTSAAMTWCGRSAAWKNPQVMQTAASVCIISK